MISSAVVIPEQEPDRRSPSPSLKRRQSSITSESNKRPRLDTQLSTENGSQPNSAGAMSPPSRRRSALGVGAIEEKKRGQRLFGALLGTLSQTSTKPAHRKRDEIEQRQRERVRKDTEDREEERRQKREELDRRRRVEQKVWDRESLRVRHQNMRATAGFLQTKTEPRLYYKPWELREEEEEVIKQQISQIEERIRIELVEAGAQDDAEGNERNGKGDSSHGKHDENGAESAKQEGSGDSSEGSKERNDGDSDSMKIDDSKDHDEPVAEPKLAEEDRPKEDENAGEELVEGQEDDVIY